MTEIDNQSIISDITNVSDETEDSKLFELKFSGIILKLGTELETFSMDNLKEKHKELGLSNYSKLKKPLLISALIATFVDLLEPLKDKKKDELKSICKQYNIKITGSSKKENLILHIVTYLANNLKFKLDDPISVQDIPIQVEEKPPLSLMEQLEKQRLEIEQKMKEELERQEEEIKRKAEEELKRKAEEDAKKREEEETKRKTDKEEAKKKKQSIPKNVRVIVWNHYIGEDIIKHKCLCCKKVRIESLSLALSG
jgi:hypothetical protein